MPEINYKLETFNFNKSKLINQLLYDYLKSLNSILNEEKKMDI